MENNYISQLFEWRSRTQGRQYYILFKPKFKFLSFIGKINATELREKKGFLKFYPCMKPFTSSPPINFWNTHLGSRKQFLLCKCCRSNGSSGGRGRVVSMCALMWFSYSASWYPFSKWVFPLCWPGCHSDCWWCVKSWTSSHILWKMNPTTVLHYAVRSKHKQ